MTSSSIRFTSTMLFSSLNGRVTGLRFKAFAMDAAVGGVRDPKPGAPDIPDAAPSASRAIPADAA